MTVHRHKRQGVDLASTVFVFFFSDPPVFASAPHFYQGDKELLKAIDGLRPNKSLHGTFISVEPVSSCFWTNLSPPSTQANLYVLQVVLDNVIFLEWFKDLFWQAFFFLAIFSSDSSLARKCNADEEEIVLKIYFYHLMKKSLFWQFSTLPGFILASFCVGYQFTKHFLKIFVDILLCLSEICPVCIVFLSFSSCLTEYSVSFSE